MADLLRSMEGELNRLHERNKELLFSGAGKMTPELVEESDLIDWKISTLRKLIGKYASIQTEYLELTGAYSVY